MSTQRFLSCLKFVSQSGVPLKIYNKEAGARGARAIYFQHSTLTLQVGGRFSSVLLVDSYVSRRFPRFRLKNRRTFRLFTTGHEPLNSKIYVRPLTGGSVVHEDSI